MKRILFLVIFLPTISFAQFGIKTGISYNWFSNTKDQQPQINYSGGLIKISKLSNRFSLQTELLYTVKSSSINKSQRAGYEHDTILVTPEGNFNFEYHYHYLEIPILIRYNCLNNFYLNVGISPSFTLWSQYSYIWPYDKSELFQPLNSNTFDLPVLASIGYQIKLTDKETIFFELRGSKGLFNQYQNNKFNNIGLSAGILF